MGICAAILFATWFGLSKVGIVTALKINSNLEGGGLAHCLNIVATERLQTSADLAPRVAKIAAQTGRIADAVGLGRRSRAKSESRPRPQIAR